MNCRKMGVTTVSAYQTLDYRAVQHTPAESVCQSYAVIAVKFIWGEGIIRGEMTYSDLNRTA